MLTSNPNISGATIANHSFVVKNDYSFLEKAVDSVQKDALDFVKMVLARCKELDCHKPTSITFSNTFDGRSHTELEFFASREMHKSWKTYMSFGLGKIDVFYGFIDHAHCAFHFSKKYSGDNLDQALETIESIYKQHYTEKDNVIKDNVKGWEIKLVPKNKKFGWN